MVMEAQPSPQSVGREFVRQYYTLLNKAPDHLHRFYNNSSSFVHGGLDSKNQEATLVIGQKQIHSKIQQLNFRDCHAKISQVDSQATLGNGVVVQVTGELSNDGQPMRRFTQTFVLAAQSPKNYYVHNDIFRYQDVYSDDEIDENDRSGGEDEGDVAENNAIVDQQNVNVVSQQVANVVAPAAVAPNLGGLPAPQQQPQQQQQPPLYYPPGVMNTAGPTGMIPSYGQPQPAQQQLNGVHDDLLKAVPPQSAAQLLQQTAGAGHPSAVPQQNPVLQQQVPNVAPGIPSVDPIPHLAQQQQQQPVIQQQQTATRPTATAAEQFAPVPQQQQPQQQPQPIPEPEPLQSSLAMNELDSALPSVNDPTPAEASDSHDHRHLSDQQQQQHQQPPNEPKTYANLVKSGGAGGPGPLSFASVSSHHHQQQQQQSSHQQQSQQQQHHQQQQQQGYNNVTAGRQSGLSPPPSGLQSGNAGGPVGGRDKYDRQSSQQQQQQQDQQGGLGGGPMPQRGGPNQQRPIRGNGPPSSQGPLRQQQDGRPSYSSRYQNDGDDRRQSSTSQQFGDNHQLFLGNIPHHATEDELKTLFSKYGTVVDLRIHSKPGQKVPGVRAPPNYGFITYDDPAAVQNCLANTPLYFPENSPDGQKLNVEEKKTRSMRGPGETGGRLGGQNLGGGNGSSGGPRGGPPGSMNRGGSGQRGMGSGTGRGGYQRSDRAGGVSGGQRPGNGNYQSNR